MPDTERTIATDIPPTAARNLFVDQDASADQGDVSSPAESGSMNEAVGPTPHGDLTEPAEESAAVGPSRVEVAFRHASGSARLLVPRDLPLAELRPEFLELAGVDERSDAWVLTSGEGAELPTGKTLGECGVHDRDAIVLRRRGVAPPTAVPEPSRAPREAVSRRTNSRQAKPARGKRPGSATGRALSERTAHTLPAKLTAIARVCEALRALRGARSSVIATPPASAGIPAPGAFALPARAPLRVRMRDAWEYTDDRRRLERMIISPHLLRCATVAVVSPKGDYFATRAAVPSASGRADGVP